MRYFFHLESNTHVHIDHLGKEFTRKRAAVNHARTMARTFAQEERWAGWSLAVIDSNNVEVFRVSIQNSILTG